jgi:hypothetical protein
MQLLFDHHGAARWPRAWGRWTSPAPALARGRGAGDGHAGASGGRQRHLLFPRRELPSAAAFGQPGARRGHAQDPRRARRGAVRIYGQVPARYGHQGSGARAGTVGGYAHVRRGRERLAQWGLAPQSQDRCCIHGRGTGSLRRCRDLRLLQPAHFRARIHPRRRCPEYCLHARARAHAGELLPGRTVSRHSHAQTLAGGRQIERRLS